MARDAPKSRGMKSLLSPPRTAIVLARLLERLDASRQPVDAHQYQGVAARLAALLSDPEVDWQPLLAASPAAAALYENLHYGEAGLCRTPLDAAMRAELQARQAIAAARAAAAPGTPSDAEDRP